MKNKNIPTDIELPSIGKLVKSTILTMSTAAIILVTAVLPAEYGIDPTGVGKFIGLTEMGEIKVLLAEELADDAAKARAGLESGANNNLKPSATLASNEVSAGSKSGLKTDEIKIILTAGEGKELKLLMNKGDQVKYVWWTDGGKVVFDSHADSKEVKYHNYAKGKDERYEGVLEAAFDGNHGWYWKNRAFEPLTITLQLSGEFSGFREY